MATAESVKMMEERLGGLNQRLVQLRATERIFLQAQALEAQMGTAQAELDGYQKDLEPVKAELAELIKQRADVVNTAIVEFAQRMEEALPEGKASIRVTEENKVVIGWFVNGTLRPYRALSGGERVSFDMALCHAIGAELIIKEAAELDDKRIELTLAQLAKLPEQVFLVTCHQADPMGLWKVCAPQTT